MTRTVFVCAIAAALFLSGAPAQATFPGTNGRIAFESTRDGNFEIYTMNPDGTGVARLTNNPGFDLAPAWSADGSKIAFSRQPEPGVDREIFTMNADGSGVTQLTSNAMDDFDPAWSPAGTRIVFSRNTGSGFDLYVMNADGTGETQLTHADAATIYGGPDWSPDGTSISAWRGLSLRFSPALYLTINPDGTGEQVLGNGGETSWAPAGDRLAVQRSFFVGPDPFQSQSDLFTVNPDGTNESRLTNTDTVSEEDPAWSPDGTKIAFFSNTDTLGEIYVMNRDGTSLQNLTNSPSSRDAGPSWQPLVGPQRGDFKNAAQFCKALREFLGDEVFRNRFGGGANAHGKCVTGDRR